jgi:hypothetical protein
MREDVYFGPARQIQLGSGWQKLETGLRHFSAAFASEHDVKGKTQLM